MNNRYMDLEKLERAVNVLKSLIRGLDDKEMEAVGPYVEIAVKLILEAMNGEN